MRSERFHRRLRHQRHAIVATAILMVAATLLILPGIAQAKTINYRFVFEHTDGTTTEISGTSSDNTAFLPNAGGTSKDNPTGMEVHVSCSDEFPGGWGKKDGPVQGVDTEWRIRSFEINKDGKVCGGGDPEPPARPAIDIEKATNGEDADDPTGPRIPVGDPVTWTYVVTNTGNTPLTNVEVIDYVPTVGSADATRVDCPQTALRVGQAMTCTMTGIAEEGQYANEAKVTALGSAGTGTGVFGDSKKQFTFIFEHTDGTTTRIDGGAEKNEVFLSNAGGTSIDNPTGMTVHVSCSDPFTGGWGQKDGPVQGVDTEWHIQAFFIREVKDGQIKKSCGSPIPDTQVVMDQDPSHYIGIPGDPDIDIEKHTNGEDADRAPGPRLNVGDVVTWTYIVTNTGSVDLFDIEVTDDIEGFIGTIDHLAAGETETLTKRGRVVAGGQYANEGCAVGFTRDGREVDDCDPSHYKPRHEYDDDRGPRVDIEKATNGIDADHPRGPEIAVGATVTWTYTVTNIGDVPLYSIYVYDEEEGRVSCPNRNLQPNQSVVCTLTGKAKAGQYANEAWVNAWAADGTRASDEDMSHYFGVSGDYDVPQGISLEKRVAGSDADTPPGVSVAKGSTIEFTYLVKNTGNDWLWGIYLYDEDFGHISCPGKSLAPGAQMTCRFSTTARSGLNGNDAWVDGWAGSGRVTATDPGWYTGS